MYKIEKASDGIRLIFGGFIQKAEMSDWVADVKKILNGLPAKFGVFVDMRELKPLATDAQSEMQVGQKLFKEKGMERSVVVVDNTTTMIQFKHIGKETGIYAWERYLTPSKTPNWEEVATKWLVQGIDPDL